CLRKRFREYTELKHQNEDEIGTRIQAVHNPLILNLVVLQMSEEEDTELRDLAQLRASIFLAIDDQEKIKSKGPLSNERMEKYSQTEIGRICCGLISDFFQCMTMKATQSVFKPESGSKEISTRDQTAKFLDIELTKEIKDDVPLLEIVLNSALKLGRISNGYANELIKSDVKKATSPFSDQFKKVTAGEVSSENGRSNLLGDLPNLTSAASTFASFSKSTPAMKNKTSNEFSLKDLIGDSDDVSEDEISEEIVEDLEVEDLLNSSHSPHQISF
uniref:FGFR1 oncogene partner (FOP) N-terminal dimerisation domain-containing protein n=1 Tax=Romanomermis culicivorax TaxID=13658 RepID=A0A915IP69_ROMCU